MRHLTITHPDFSLQFECVALSGAFEKAKRNLGVDALCAFYTATEPAIQVALDEDPIPLSDKSAQPFFFDNTDYAVWVDFKDKPGDCTVRSRLQSVSECFSYHKDKGILSGFLNFGNDIGRSDFTIQYRLNGMEKTFTFGFEVLSSKLDYHQHWKRIVEDVEAEYRMLSLDFLRKTYHSFTQEPTGETPEIIWWNLFKQEQTVFIKACNLILNRPKRRVRPFIEYRRADQLKMMSPRLENELAEHRWIPTHHYRSEAELLSHDTPENRFLKFALHSIARKHERLSERIEAFSNLSDSAKSEIQETRKTLATLCGHPFFRTVGKFTTLNQESLILQRAAGYATVARVYAVLQAAYALKDGLYRLETKDIATLYEIWCFIEVKNIVKQLYGDDAEVDCTNRQELCGRFRYDLSTGAQSRILFKGKDGVELAALLYNAKTNKTSANGIQYSVSPTGVAQIPDIVLQLTKPFNKDKAFKLTYLFDAKYRIADKEGSGVDTPPDDAINQMHRYRDAIYYANPREHGLYKEVVGGYILFPGTGDPLVVQQANFYKSIATVNIGAFPLRPGDAENRDLLQQFISTLLHADVSKQLGPTIPQKGMSLRMADVSDAEMFLRDAPMKFVQESAVKTGVYPAPIGSTSKPERVEWILLSLSNRPVRLLKVKRFLGQFQGSEICGQYPDFERVGADFKDREFYLWSIEEIAVTK